jgi:hypothetical protein
LAANSTTPAVISIRGSAPFVRVDATRLRAKLREYYASERAADSLIIDLPKGTYTPAFHPATNVGAANAGQMGYVPVSILNQHTRVNWFAPQTCSLIWKN